MDAELKTILEKTRELLFKNGFQNVTPELVARETGIEMEKLVVHFKNIPDIVDKLLRYENISFEEIFEDYNFDGMNAVDILLIVSREVHDRFLYVNPSITFELKKVYPDLYKAHIEEKLEFMYQKIKINIEKGIAQGMYKSNLEPDKTAREFINWFYNVHQPEHSPNGGYSFGMIFDMLFENFIDYVANESGLEYYNYRKSFFDVLNFGH